MKTTFTPYYASRAKILWILLLLLLHRTTPALAQATVATPMGMGDNCGGGSNAYKIFNYNTSTQALSTLSSCSPSLLDPTTGAVFSPQSGSTTFDPVTQELYYIETTSGNNSIIWTWSPTTCPTGNLAPIYTFSNDFIVGLEFNTVTGMGYQIEFSTGSAPYTVYLREITSFSPAVFGTSVPITFPAGVTINSQNSDYVITPTGVMYLAIDNKIFSLNYSTYTSGVLNATYLGAVSFSPSSDYIVGLAYADGKLIASITNSSSSCLYRQIDVSSGTPVLTTVGAPTGSSALKTFSSTDMATLITGVGAAKKVSSVTMVGSNYQVQYDVKVRNFGNVNLTGVQVVDNLEAVFGSVLVSASAAAVGTLPSGLTVNTAYNGNTNTNLFASGGTMIASPPDSAVVRITATLTNPNLNYTYNNSAIATATGTLFSKSVTDSSNNSTTLNPDPNNNAVPDDPGEGVPTPLILSNWTVLSTNIIDFNGQTSNNGNNLHWTLQNNQGSGSGIYVQRSTDGQNFENLVQIPAQAAASQDYSWSDAHAQPGANYYRLQLVMAGGSTVYSDVIALRNTDPNEQLQISPNPFREFINFSLSLPAAAQLTYRILDISSHVVAQGQASGQAGSNTITINGLNNAPSGVYVLEVQTADSRYFKKLTKLE